MPNPKMTPAQIREKLKKIVIEQLGVEDVQVTDSAHFENDLGTDSLDRVELVMAIEEEFELAVSEDEEDALEKLETFGEVADYLGKRMGGAN